MHSVLHGMHEQLARRGGQGSTTKGLLCQSGVRVYGCTGVRVCVSVCECCIYCAFEHVQVYLCVCRILNENLNVKVTRRLEPTQLPQRQAFPCPRPSSTTEKNVKRTQWPEAIGTAHNKRQSNNNCSPYTRAGKTIPLKQMKITHACACGGGGR